MRLGAWVMISPTWGSSATAAPQRWGESRLFSRITRSTRLPRMPRQTRSRAQTLRCPSPSQGDASRSASMATSRASSEIEGFGPRRFAGGRSAVALPGFHGVERGTGKTPGRTDPLEAVGQTRAGRGGGTHRRDLRRPKGPDAPPWPRAVSSTCMINSPIRFMAMSSSAFTGSPLRSLSEADPGDRLLTPLLEPENLHAQLPRQKFHRLATQKPQGNLTLARHRPPLAKSQRACGETWPGENVDEPSSPSFTTGPSATLFSKLSVMFRSSLDTD